MKRVFKLFIAIIFFSLIVSVKAKSYTEEEYKSLNINRSYIVCNYLFDVGVYNPTLKDLLLAAQSCPNNQISLYEIKYAKDINGKLTTSFMNLLTNKKLSSFPELDVRFIERGSVATKTNETVVDSTPNTNTYDLETISVDSTKFESLGVKRTYVVGSYIFDLSSHNPTLSDLMLANQTADKGTAKIYEIKYGEDINGNPTKIYNELLDGNTLSTFPSLQERYIYYDEVKPTQPNSEAKIDLLNNTNPGEAAGIKISYSDIVLKLGESVLVTAEVLPVGATNNGFNWVSNNPDVVSVDNGVITAKTGGKTTVTVTNGNAQVTIDVEVIDNNQLATITCENKVWNGTPQQIAICSGGIIENNIQTDGGNYQITCEGDENHQSAVPETCKILRTDTTTSLSEKNVIYTGDVQPMTGATSVYNSTNGAIENPVYDYHYYTDSSCTNSLFENSLDAPIDAGTYYVKAVLKIHENYNSSESPCTKFFIDKQQNTYEIIPQTSDYTGYGIDAVAELTYSKSIEQNLKVNFTYYTDSACQNKTTVDMSANDVEGGTPIAGGTYYVIAVSEGNNNYYPVTSECTQAVTINKVDAVCPEITSFEGDYDGELHPFTVTKDAIGGTAKYCTENCEEEANWSTELPKRRNGGTTTVQIKVVPDVSHNAITCDAKTIKIDKIKNDITVTYFEADYTSEEIPADVSAHEVTRDLINVKYYTDEYCQNEVRPVNVGLYYIEITTPETDDYLETTTINNPPDNCPIGLKINKVATTTTLEDVVKVYNGSYQEVDTAVSKFNSNSLNIANSNNLPTDTPNHVYTYYNDLGCLDDNIINGYAPKNAGTYSVKATLTGTDNYESSSVCAPYTMNKDSDSINIQKQVVPYRGDLPIGTGVTAKPERSTKGNAVTYTYYTESTCRAGTETTLENAVGVGKEPFAAGIYYVIATTDHDPENINYEFVTTPCTEAVEITKIDSIITCSQIKVNNENHNIIYNNSNQVLAECNGGTFENGETVIYKNNAGDYLLTCTGDSDHETVQKTCTIDKAPTETVVYGNNSNVMNAITRDYKSGTRQGVDRETDHILSHLTNKQDVEFMGDYNYEYYMTSDCTGSALSSVPIDVRVNELGAAIPYFVKVTLEGTSNYETSYTCVPFTINKIHSTITVNYRDNIAYTGDVVEATATSTSNSNITFRYYTNSNCSLETTSDDNGAATVGGAPRNAGTYYVRATSAETSNYLETTTDCEPALSIKSIYASCPTVTSYEGTYDGEPHHVTVTDTEGIGGTVMFKVDDITYGTNGAWVLDPPTRVDVGTSVVQVKVEGDSTHLTQSCPSKEVKINKKLDEITVNPDTVTHVVEVEFDGSTHEAVVTSISGENIYTSYYTDANCSTPIIGKPINVGTYYVRAQSLCPDNSNYDSSEICALAVRITKKDSTCPANISETIVPYDGNAHQITATGNYTGGTLEFRKAGGSWSTTNPSIVNVPDSTTVEVRIHNTDGNYNDADCGTYNLTINKVSPQINCTNPTYTANTINIATSIGCTLSGNNQVNAGAHTVTCTGDANHLDKESTCNINKSDTTTSIPEQNKYYNGYQQEATNPSSNLSSTNAPISGGEYTFKYYLDDQCTHVTTTPKYGGTYYVVATLLDTSNYNSSSSPCTRYVMNQNKPKVVISCISRTYNGSPQVIASCSQGGTLVESTATRTNAGTYTVYCTGDDEHMNADPVDCTINKAESTCPALSSVTATYDEHDHYLSGNPEAGGGIAEFKLDRCQYENHTTNNIPTDCDLVWTSTFRPYTAVNIRGTTYISIRVQGDENHNDRDCPTLSITLN